ncbi:GNAT family N-acetyltransferase [Nocardia arthritidis]|uniref:GNAT family N-acetyltransferase n=1 Tax=Nocardia arthritidis TaxID=228602 RepID=UPI0019345236|nr:GNAT family N-acetyltransferase [Nocardia arthritidis]
MDSSVIGIRRLGPDEWATFRRLRLLSLADAPHAFGATLAEAQRRTEAGWRALLAGRVQFVATVDGAEVGTIGGLADPERDGAHLISMWVAPGARGTGVGDVLVRALVDWARGAGYRRVWLEVAEGNVVAEKLYLRNGFARTGVRSIISPANPRPEFEMMLEF